MVKFDRLDIRDLISVENVMEELNYGPNGGLIFCMQYLLDNIEWLHDKLSQLPQSQYILFDSPGYKSKVPNIK